MALSWSLCKAESTALLKLWNSRTWPSSFKWTWSSSMYLTNRRSSSQKRQWSMTAVSLCKTVLNCFARASKPTGTLPPPSLLGMMEQNTTTLPEPQNLPKSSAAMVSGDTDKLQMLLPPHNTTTTSCFCDIGCCKYAQRLVSSVKPIFLTVERLTVGIWFAYFC